MSENPPRPERSVEAIDRDFADLIASRLPTVEVRDKFERLWDEASSIAAQTVETPEGQRYISLLKRMHQTFKSHYRTGAVVNGFRKHDR